MSDIGEQLMQPSNVPRTEAAPGLTLADGRYRLVRQLGRGGYGRVWLAEDSALGVEVAVKEVAVPPGSSAGVTAEMIERATSEARNAARLRDHPNIVTVHDVLVERGVPWTVMQYVPGRSLADEIDLGGPVPVPAAQRIAVAMLSALSACHEAGVIHRDVKPHNIMLAADGTPMLTDFGIAKAAGQATMTAEGMVAGSVAYIAPERAKGERATSASDLFSLGVTLYHAVEGASPFDRGSGMATLAALLLEDLPESVRAGALAPVIRGLTDKDPAERLTAEQATALLDGRQTVPQESATRRETAVIDPRLPMRRHTVVALSALAAAFAALLVCGIIGLAGGDSLVVATQLAIALRAGVIVDAVLVGVLCAKGVRHFRAGSGRAAGIAAFLLGAGVTITTLLAALVAFADFERIPGMPVHVELEFSDALAVVLGVFLLAALLLARWTWAAGRSRHRPGYGRPSRRAVLTVDSLALIGALLAWGLWPAPMAPAPPTVAQVGELPGPATAYSVQKVKFSPDGRTLATVYGDQTVQVWEVAGRRQIGRLLGPFGTYSWDVDTAFSADGRILTTTEVDNGTCVVQSWEAATGRAAGQLRVDPAKEGTVEKVSLSADGRAMAVTPAEDSADLGVRLWDVPGDREIGGIGATSDEHSVKLSPDGRVAVTIRIDPATGTHLTLWDVDGHRQIGDPITLSAGDELQEYEFSPDGRLLMTATSPPDDFMPTTVRLWDVSSHNQARRPITVPYAVASIALSPDGRTLAAVGGALGLWNIDTGQQIGAATGGTGAALTFSPDGRTLAVRGKGSTLRLLNVPAS
ncbi:WD40 repeat domain-containing serine/threonine protein kinase [Amycolatopsis alba]|uniref:WD40 repeat domain-containing serine/threonine protein kinase n=1 Tax=Amycolatopsis alba TaxID=76020 RepID=UPI0006869956|nr:serine/threonine-protein kinase [Amycolatopsis alba]